MPYAHLPHLHHEETEKYEVLKQQLERAVDFETTADLFKLVADPTRIRIFWLLCHCEECVINISAMMEMSSPAVSHHLRALKNSGLIVSHREGKEVHYRAADTPQARLLHEMIETMMDYSCKMGDP